MLIYPDDWEVKKLGELGYTYSGLTGKTKSDFEKGNGKFITFLNVLNNIKIDINILERVNINEKEKQNAVKVGDLFFNASSETPEEVGMCAVLLENPGICYLNSFCFGYRLKKKFDYHYLAFYFRAHNFRKCMMTLAQGISRYNISKAKVMDSPILYPSICEQRIIASCLMAVDDLIKAQAQKIALLEQHKKGLMQQLFPEI